MKSTPKTLEHWHTTAAASASEPISSAGLDKPDKSHRLRSGLLFESPWLIRTGISTFVTASGGSRTHIPWKVQGPKPCASASYGRFADNAIWLEHHESKMSKIKTACGSVEAEHDRTIWILKSRDGSGTNTRITFEFNKNNLTLNETGIVTRKGKTTGCRVD